ncbi:hypothetical protein [Streptomyces chryseus]|nr:hypothetical protein [Streptomyces chryseus]
MTDSIRGTRYGSAPAALSVLDSAMTGTGQSWLSCLVLNRPGRPHHE